jgi:hypothetical protein
LGPAAFVRETPGGDVFPFWVLSVLYFLQNDSNVVVVEFS